VRPPARRWSIAAALAVSLASAAARADVTWSAPAGCPGRDVLLERVAAELGRPVPDDLALDGRVEQAGARWRVVLDLADGERSLDAASCDELVSAAALIIAIALETPGGGGATDAPAPAEAAEPPETEMPPTAVIAAPPAPVARPRPAPPSPLAVRVRAAVGSDLGAMPELATGFGGGFELGLGAWAVDVNASRWIGQRATSQPDQGADLELTTAAVRGCRAFVPGARWRATACTGAEIDALEGVPFGFTEAQPSRILVGGGAAVGGAIAVRVAGPVWLRLDAGATALVRRVAYTESTGMPGVSGALIHRMGWVLGRTFLSAEIFVP